MWYANVVVAKGVLTRVWGEEIAEKILVDRGDMCVDEGFRVRVWSETKVRVLRLR